MLPPQVVGSFGYGQATAAGATAFIQGVEPYRGVQGAPPQMYVQKPGVPTSPNWWGQGCCKSVISKILYTNGATAHKCTIMRPFNFAYVTTAVAKNTATFILDLDPGVYSTNYRYHTPSNAVPALADNAISAGDYVAYQLSDGTWVFDTVASGTYAALVLTTSLPNITGVTVPVGQAMFFFGVVTDKDPGTGQLNPQTTLAASVQASYNNDLNGLWTSLHPGDPLIFYSPNTTNAGTLDLISGYYAIG